MRRSPALPLLLLAACTQPAIPPPPPSATPNPPSPPPVAVAPATPAPAETLDRLDARRPLALLPQMAAHQKQNMREHLEAVQAIVAGLGASDFAAVERAASRIGYSEQMGAMCNHMGAGDPEFTPTAIRFHKTADTIAEAARARDREKVVTALAATLATCTGCHATWKQRVVDESEWTRLTSAAPPAMHHGR